MAYEPNADYTYTLRHLWFLFDEGRKVKAVSSLADPSQGTLWVAELRSALVAKKLELQSLPGLADENFSLCTEVSRLRDPVDTLG